MVGAGTTTGALPTPPPPPVAGVGVVVLSGGGAWATTVGLGAAMIPPRFGLMAVPTTKPNPSASAAKVLTVWIGTGSTKPDRLAAAVAPAAPAGSA